MEFFRQKYHLTEKCKDKIEFSGLVLNFKS